MCISFMILFFVLYEIGVVALFRWAGKNHPEMNVWIALGSKVVKLLLAAGFLLLVHLLIREPLVRFALVMLAVLLLSVLFESAYCLRIIKNEKTKQS